MDLKAVGQRIKAAREAKNLTQEELAALVNLSTTPVSYTHLDVYNRQPFVSYYFGIILHERYFKDQIWFYPVEWILADGNWGTDKAGL